MRKTIVILMALMGNMWGFAQKAETVESIITNSRDTEWYPTQAEAWQKKVDANPKDEWAWRNLFLASYYHEQRDGGIDNQDQSRTADVLRKMEATLPDSYVLNLSKARFCLSKDDEAQKRGYFIHRAIDLMPEDAYGADVDFLATRLWSIAPEDESLNELFFQSYQRKSYPMRIMQCNNNMLQSMDARALYFANGDVVTIPMKMIQEALEERQDVTVIPISFFHSEPFMAALYKKLDIKPLTIDINDYGKYGEDWYKYYEADVIKYLMKETQRPTYFHPDILKETKLNKDSIYNEGLLLKYSPVPYDNFAVALHNVTEVYHLEYLAEPDLVYDNWEASLKMDMNCVALLQNLVTKLLDKDNNIQALRLYNILDGCKERKMMATYLNFKRPEVQEAFEKKFEEMQEALGKKYEEWQSPESQKTLEKKYKEMQKNLEKKYREWQSPENQEALKNKIEEAYKRYEKMVGEDAKEK